MRNRQEVGSSDFLRFRTEQAAGYPCRPLNKPSAIDCCSAGHFGGVRAAMTLRAMLAQMGISSIPSIFPVPQVQDAFVEDGTPSDTAWEHRAEKS